MNTLEQTPQGWIFSTLDHSGGTHWDRVLVKSETELAEHIRNSRILRRECGKIGYG